MTIRLTLTRLFGAGLFLGSLAACDPDMTAGGNVIPDDTTPPEIAIPEIAIASDGLAGAWAVHSYYPAPDEEFQPNLFTMQVDPDSSFVSQMTCNSWECAEIGSVAIAGYKPEDREISVPFRFAFLPSGTYRVLAESDTAPVMALLHTSQPVAWVFRRATTRATQDVNPALSALRAEGFDPAQLVPVPNPFATR